METFMNTVYRLCDMKAGECATVKEQLASYPFKRRLSDIGLIAGTEVSCLFQSCGKDIKAYLIRGAVIAIRNEDCTHVIIEKKEKKR
jgi:ferrous iron transport protein A